MESARLALLSRTSERIRHNMPVRLVLYGDSISEVGRSDRWHGGASAPERNWGALVRSALARTYPDCDFSLRHFGVGGQNAYEGLGRLDWLEPLAPDLVLVAFGANDCGYHYLLPEETCLALKTLATWIPERYAADVVLVGTAGDNPRASFFHHLETTVDATRRAASDAGVPFVDLRTAMLAVTRHGANWAKYHLAEDNCHPNDAGHRVWAETVLEELRRHLP